MLAHRTSVVTEGARNIKREQIRDYKSNQGESGNEEDCRWNQVRPKMIDPPAGDRWNGKHDRDDQNAFAICNSKDSREQHQRKQNRYNKISAFDFFDKRCKDEEQRREQRAVARWRSDGILVAAARASLILPFLVRFRSCCLIAVILSEAKLQRSGQSPRGQAFNL